MRTIALPYSGELLLSHLVAYGLGVALDAAGAVAYVEHPRDSLSFTPSVHVEGDLDDATIAAAIRATADTARDVVEADLVPGRSGNDRRSVIWARGSMANDTSQADGVVARRAELVAEAARVGDRPLLGVLAGLGSAASWGPEHVKPSHGATILDGVLGNHTSDMVRGVLRPARTAASGVDAARLWEVVADQNRPQLDKTGWAPPGTAASLIHQWLAVLGLGLLPVAHRPVGPSVTPACWPVGARRIRGITLPLLGRASSLARLRAILGLRALAAVGPAESEEAIGAAAELRAMGVPEVATFERVFARGQGSSVAFSFGRGGRIEL